MVGELTWFYQGPLSKLRYKGKRFPRPGKFISGHNVKPFQRWNIGLVHLKSGLLDDLGAGITHRGNPLRPSIQGLLKTTPADTDPGT